MDALIPLRMTSPLETKINEIANLARENLALANLSGPEKLAALAFEKLKLSLENRFASDIITGMIMAEIEGRNLWSVHPEGYGSAEEAYGILGLSNSEVSDLRTLTKTITPYLTRMERFLSDFDATETLVSVGKSNIRTLTPVLRVLITGEPSKQDKVNEYAEKVYSDTERQFKEMGTNATHDEITMHAVKSVLEVGRGVNIEVRKELRGSDIHILEGIMVGKNGRRYAIIELTEEADFLTFARLEGKYLNIARAGKDDELTAIPMFRQLLEANV